MAALTVDRETVPAGPAFRASRQLERRIRQEYTEMPGLSLSPRQGARLWSIPPDESERLLVTLVHDGFLTRDRIGRYRRRGTQQCWEEP
jgi:hypothetical protein